MFESETHFSLTLFVLFQDVPRPDPSTIIRYESFPPEHEIRQKYSGIKAKFLSLAEMHLENYARISEKETWEITIEIIQTCFNHCQQRLNKALPIYWSSVLKSCKDASKIVLYMQQHRDNPNVFHLEKQRKKVIKRLGKYSETVPVCKL